MQKEHSKLSQIITIPNLLSFLRLGMIPLLVYLYLNGHPVWTTVVLVASGVTDAVDGYIARRFNMVSDFGKALDPVADKLTQFAMMLCLFTRFPAMMIPAALLFIKELASGISSLVVIRKTGKVSSAAWHGKVCTIYLYAMMTLHIVWLKIPSWVSYFSVGIAVGWMIFSFILYIFRNVSELTANAADREE